MTRRTCPICPKRYAGLVDVQCPVCEGVGVLALGPAALHRSDPAVVARAVELFLEAAAREAARLYPPGGLRHDVMVLAARKLRDAGVIAPPLGVSEVEGHRQDPPEGPAQRLADAEASRYVLDQFGLGVRPQDRANVDADQVLYEPDDRPLASGLLPRVSADGWPSVAVQACDPRDALGPSTRALAYARASSDRLANVLVKAVDRAADMRVRRGLASPA